ncbi:Uncharacterized protein HZ326_26898 [Fusarium oxysporum f. sp. albedinis]|nr:Uncharacterized protein HZ326_26898 [Fusarium oxysporum f. sp. albedinis]
MHFTTRVISQVTQLMRQPCHLPVHIFPHREMPTFVSWQLTGQADQGISIVRISVGAWPGSKRRNRREGLWAWLEGGQDIVVFLGVVRCNRNGVKEGLGDGANGFTCRECHSTRGTTGWDDLSPPLREAIPYLYRFCGFLAAPQRGSIRIGFVFHPGTCIPLLLQGFRRSEGYTLSDSTKRLKQSSEILTVWSANGVFSTLRRPKSRTVFGSSSGPHHQYAIAMSRSATRQQCAG